VVVKAVVIVKDHFDERMSSVVSNVFDSLQIIRSDEDVVSLIYMDPPDIILIDRTYLLEHDSSIVQEFRSNTIYGHLPIVAIYNEEDLSSSISLQDIPLDDFIISTHNELVIEQRLRFISLRARRELDTNPLTRLPGNESIIRYIQQMFDAGIEVAISWADIDNFKPYNDRYGFSRGDEVLLATARIITNAVKEIKREDTFVGHVGGDDFVFICPISNIRSLCEEIISRFDMVIRNFYNDEDLEQGGIISKDRSGETKKFPVMSISLAVIMNEEKRYKHYGHASQEATEIKRYVKGIDGSNYMIDRRGKKR
jgi:diguanylate cyclase (GGDEF)-like protein